MTERVILAEAVEAAAKIIYDLRDGVRDDEEIACAALEAAAPYMLAEAWDRCLESDTPWINPYRSAE